MDKLIKALIRLSAESHLDNFDWRIPENCPIEIPADCGTGYLKNIYLKENFHQVIRDDDTLNSHYWVIRDWGGIGTFQRNENNDRRIRSFMERLTDTELTNKNLTMNRDLFGCISSLSKVASFMCPDKYAIYDSRAIYALNWLLFNHSNLELFPQPTGRNAKLSKYDLQTIFRLINLNVRYKPHDVAYHEYCQLLRQLSQQVFGEDSRPYKVEMLLFMVATTKIIEQITNSVSVTITIPVTGA